MAAHRYWALFFLQAVNSSGFWASAIAEMELRDAVGGPDLTGSGTATTTGNGTAANAFDNNTSTLCENTGFGGPWQLRYDFGLGNAYDIIEVAITARPSGDYTNESLKHGVLAYSDDGSTWFPAWGIWNQTGWGAGETRVFTKHTSSPLTRRYWRLLPFETAGGNPGTYGVREMQLRDAVGGSDITGSGTPNGGSNVTNIANAFDNDTTTSAGTTSGVYQDIPDSGFGYDFGSDVRIVEVALTSSPTDFFPTDAVAKALLECSTDGANWVTMFEAQFGGAWGSNETRAESAPVVNTPPDPPTVTTVDQITYSSARLTKSAFSDDDVGDTQQAFRARVRRTSDLVITEYSIQSGTGNIFTATGLLPETEYQASFNVQDTFGDEWSGYGAWSTAFTTSSIFGPGDNNVAIITADDTHFSVTEAVRVLEAVGYTVAVIEDAIAATLDFAAAGANAVAFIESAISQANALTIRAQGVPVLSDEGTRVRAWSSSSFLVTTSHGFLTIENAHVILYGFLSPVSVKDGNNFIHHPPDTATVIGTHFGTMVVGSGQDVHVCTAAEVGVLDTNGDALPARLVVMSWIRMSDDVGVITYTEDGETVLANAIEWLLGGASAAPPLITAWPGLGRSRVQILTAGTENHRLYRDGVLIQTWAGIPPTIYYDDGLEDLTEYCYHMVAYDPETTTDLTSNTSCVTTSEIYSLRICDQAWPGEESYGYMSQYMEEEYSDIDHAWICSRSQCPLAILLRGVNFSFNYRPGAYVLKYRPYDGGALNPHAFPLPGSTSMRVRGTVSLGQVGWYIHPWLFNELCEVGVVACASTVNGRFYGISAALMSSVIDMGLFNTDPCGEFNNGEQGIAGSTFADLVVTIRAPYYEQRISIPVGLITAKRLNAFWTCNNCGYGYSANTIELIAEQELELDPSGATYYIKAQYHNYIIETTVTLPNPLPCGWGGAYLLSPALGDIYVEQLEITDLNVCVTAPPVAPAGTVTATIDFYVLCGTLKIYGGFVPDGADQFGSADLEIRAVGTTELLYSEYEVATLLWFFGQGEHNLPYDTPLEARVRVRDLSEPPIESAWTEWLELGELKWCLELIAVPGRRRILFGEVGVDSGELAIEASPKRHIIFGEVGEEGLS